MSLLFLASFAAFASPARGQSKSQTPSLSLASAWDPSQLGETILRDPVWVYNDWSAYDELSDNIPLTEQLAMKELNEIVRLKKFGVQFDDYMMDAQVYVGDSHAAVPRPPKELKGFAKVSLRPGESKSVTVLLDRRAFSYFDVTSHDWNAAPGDFAILVGSSSMDIRLQGKYSLGSGQENR
jgi:hypothetical protein